MAIVGPRRVGVKIPAEYIGEHWWHIVQNMLDVCVKLDFTSHYITRMHRDSGDLFVLIYATKKSRANWTKKDYFNKIQF